MYQSFLQRRWSASLHRRQHEVYCLLCSYITVYYWCQEYFYIHFDYNFYLPSRTCCNRANPLFWGVEFSSLGNKNDVFLKHSDIKLHITFDVREIFHSYLHQLPNRIRNLQKSNSQINTLQLAVSAISNVAEQNALVSTLHPVSIFFIYQYSKKNVFFQSVRFELFSSVRNELLKLVTPAWFSKMRCRTTFQQKFIIICV